MKIFKKFSISLIVLLLSGFLPVFAEEAPLLDKGQITVYTQTSIGNPVSAISITVQGSGYQQTKNTDDSGKALFDNLDPKKYTVIINLTSNNFYELVSGEVVSKERTIVGGAKEEVYFGLKAKLTNGASEEEEEIKVELPSIFRRTGSSTTNLTNLTKADLTSLKEFVLHIPNITKVLFKEEVNLSADDTIGKLRKLDSYVFMDHVGEVTIASDLMPELNKRATITFYGLNIIAPTKDYIPLIVKDDQEGSKMISNVKLLNKNSISFDVDGFSTYAFRPTFVIDQDDIEITEDYTYIITGKIDDLDAEITVYLNNKKQDDKIEINEDGSFDINVVLDEGKNIVQIMARGISEQTNAEIIEIHHREDAPTFTDKDNKLRTTIIVGIFLAIGFGGFGYWYYCKKNNKPMFGFLRSKQRNAEMPYDKKLLTKEEIDTYKENSPDTTMKM